MVEDYLEETQETSVHLLLNNMMCYNNVNNEDIVKLFIKNSYGFIIINKRHAVDKIRFCFHLKDNKIYSINESKLVRGALPILLFNLKETYFFTNEEIAEMFNISVKYVRQKIQARENLSERRPR